MKSDPRVFFASERTLLAWVRTGIAVVGLGFLVSRFGLFLHLTEVQTAGPHAAGSPAHSSAIGLSLVVLGALSIGMATVQHGRFIATLPDVDRPTHYSATWAVWLSGLVSAASAALAAYLALAPH